MKGLFVGLGALVLVLFVAVGATATWFALRDPFAALPKADPAPAVVGAWSELRNDGRRLEHVTLESRSLGRIGVVVSLPETMLSQRLPLVVVLGGLGTGERNIRYITGIGDNAVIGYDWPIPTAMPNGVALLRAAPDLYRRALSIPGQIATAMLWLRQQPWADAERVSLLGFSLGALAAPSTQRVAALSGADIPWTVLAYGGAPIGALVDANPFVRPPWVRPVLRALVDLTLRPVEPSAHLPHLRGRFLVLEGSDDRFVPAPAAALLRDLTPEPKTVVRFPGGHMGVGADQLRLLDTIIAKSRAWLVDEGAVNPPP